MKCISNLSAIKAAGLALAALALLAWPQFSVGAAPPPAIAIPVCTQPPVMDGSLSDECWQAAMVITNFYIVGEQRQTSANRACVMRDNQWLYVAFDVAHPHPNMIKPAVNQRDGLVQRENCVKVAFDPGTDGALWYHIRLSAGNVLSDQRNSRGKGAEKEGWNIPVRSATRIGGRGWQAELALPFALLMTVGEPEKARMDLIIHTFLPIIDQQAVKVGETREVASWADVPPEWWKAPERFIKVLELEKAEFKVPFLPFLKNARVTGYTTVSNGYGYQVTADLDSLSSRGGNIRLSIVDTPDRGQTTEVGRAIELSGDERRSVSLAVPVQAIMKREIAVMLSDPAGGEILQKEIIADTSSLDLFAAYLDRSYYTAESNAVAVCRIGLPAEGLADLALQAVTTNGRVVARAAGLQPLTRFAIPLDTLPAGTTPLTIELRQKGGALVSQQAATLIKRSPKPGCEVKIDKENRVILRDGQPFFPFGFCMSHIWPSQEACFKAVGEAGFNSVLEWVVNWGNSKDMAATYDAYFKVAQKYGLQVVVWPDCYASTRLPAEQAAPYLTPALQEVYKKFNCVPKDINYYPQFKGLGRQAATQLFLKATEYNLERALAVLRACRNQPNLLAYMIFDEPFNCSFLAGRLLYARYNEEDGYHPHYTNYSSEIPPGEEAIDWIDILCTDPYWIPGGRKDRGTPTFPAYITYLTRKKADSGRKVTWIIPMAEFFSSSFKRLISPDEQRCQTYLVLINGARGVFYYLLPQHQANWDALRGLAGEMKALAPSILMPDLAQETRYEPGPFNFDQKLFPDVQAKIFRRPEGGYLLLCANSQWYPVDATFRTPLLGDSVAVRRLFAETPPMAVTNGMFTDRVEPFGTRAYVIANPATPVEPVPLSVTMKAYPDLGREERPFPRRFDGNKKNLVLNPSLEDATLPGWPDFYKVHASPTLFPDRMLGGPNAAMGLDTNSPFHGKVSLRFSFQPRQVLGCYIEEGLGHIDDPYLGDPNADFVLSAWLRADRDGLKFNLGQSPKDAVTVTKEWQRFSWRIKLPLRVFLFTNLSGQEQGTIWLDAVQIEKGIAPTEFEP